MTDSNPSDDPFFEFRSWLKAGRETEWSVPSGGELRDDQKRLVAANVSELLNPRVWHDKVERFEAALAALDEEQAVEYHRAKYEVRFDRYDFQNGSRNFQRFRFPCAVSFLGTRFIGGEVVFEEAEFVAGGVNFSGANFGHSHVTFKNAGFSNGDVSFINTNFNRAFASFVHARFGNGDVVFERASFGSKGVDFEGAVFQSGRLSFRDAVFESTPANFEKMTFPSGYVLFDGSHFGGEFVSFEGSTFPGEKVTFDGAVFPAAGVSFRDCSLEMAKLHFSDLHVAGGLNCVGLMAKAASFRNTSVDGLPDWTDAEFGTIPDFRQTKLDRSPEVARMTVPQPQLRRTRIDTFHWPVEHQYERRLLFKRATDADDVLKLRKLKAMALAANDHEKDGEFFAYEMMAKRGVEHTTFWQLLFNTIYWKVSFYGQSYLRPLAWLGTSFATFAAIYSLMAAVPIGGWQSLAFGITYSFKNSLPFLGTLTRSVPSPEGHVSWFALQLQAIKDAQPGPDWFTVLGTSQAMLSLFFFFFLLLGLRNKFRLK